MIYRKDTHYRSCNEHRRWTAKWNECSNLLKKEEAKKDINSFKKLMKYDFKNVIAYHRGLFNNNYSQKK